MAIADNRSSKKKGSLRHKEHNELRLFLRLAFCGLVLRGYDRERDIDDPILRKVYRFGKRVHREESNCALRRRTNVGDLHG